MAALALTLVGLRGMDWFARFPNRVGFWWEASLELLRLRPWGVSSGTRGQVASTLASQVIYEIPVGLLSSVLVGLTLFQPLLRLRRPRPPFREVIRQSGLVTCLGVLVGTLIVAGLWWIAGVDTGYELILISAPVLLWPTLGAFPWRSEPSWIDRLGRAVGWGWIIVAAAVTALAYMNAQS